MTTFLSALVLLLLQTPVSVKVILNQKGLAHQNVELISVSSNHQIQTLRQKTNAQGIARFDVKPSSRGFVFRTNFESVIYLSPLLSLSVNLKMPQLLTVYRSKSSDPKLQIRDLRLFARRNRQFIELEQTFVVDNPTPFVIRGNKGPHGNVVFRFSIPPGVSDLRYGEGFDSSSTQVLGNEILVSRDLFPGLHYFTLNLIYETNEIHFEETSNLPLRHVSLGSPLSHLKFSNLSFKPTPAKLLREGWIQTWKSSLLETDSVSFKISGFPPFIPLTLWLPFVTFILFSLVFLRKLKSTQKAPAQDSGTKTKLLLELVGLERLLKEGWITQDDFDERRLQLYEKIRPFYPEESTL